MIKSQPAQQEIVAVKGNKGKTKVSKVSGVTIFELNSPKNLQFAPPAVAY